MWRASGESLRNAGMVSSSVDARCSLRNVLT
jgi:hypothetical protein